VSVRWLPGAKSPAGSSGACHRFLLNVILSTERIVRIARAWRCLRRGVRGLAVLAVRNRRACGPPNGSATPGQLRWRCGRCCTGRKLSIRRMGSSISAVWRWRRAVGPAGGAASLATAAIRFLTRHDCGRRRCRRFCLPAVECELLFLGHRSLPRNKLLRRPGAARQERSRAGCQALWRRGAAT